MLRQIYKSVYNFLKHADPHRLITNEYHECTNDNSVTLEHLLSRSFSLFFETFIITDSQLIIPRNGDILAGICFPDGHAFQVKIMNKIVSEVNNVTPNKFYLPIKNLLMHYMINTQYNSLKIITNNTSAYVVYIRLRQELRQELAQNTYTFRLARNFANYSQGELHLLGEPTSTIQEYQINYQVVKIQRPWQKFTKEKERKEKERILKIKFLIHQQIRAYPGLGIDYLAGKERFEAKQS